MKDGKAGLWLAAALAVLACVLMLGGEGKTEATQTERRMAEVLSAIAGAGKVEVALFYAQPTSYGTESSTPTGAVVVAQGAADLGVRLDLIRAARTLLGLPELGKTGSADWFARGGRHDGPFQSTAAGRPAFAGDNPCPHAERQTERQGKSL